MTGDPAWYLAAPCYARAGDCLALDDLEWAWLDEPQQAREMPEMDVTPQEEHAQIERERDHVHVPVTLRATRDPRVR